MTILHVNWTKSLGLMISCGCMTIIYFRSLRHSASVGTKIASAFSFIFHARRPRC